MSPNRDTDSQGGRTKNGSMNSGRSVSSNTPQVDNQSMLNSSKFHEYDNQSSRSRSLPIDSEDPERNSARYNMANSTDSLINSTAPKDKYKLVCIGFTILGITTLLPWNFFITATDYWMYKFRNVSSTYDPHAPHTSDRTPLQTFFESYLAIAANAPMLISMILNSLYGQSFSQKKRLYVSLSVMLVIFALTTIFVKIDTDHMQSAFFAITIVMVVVVTFFSAIFQAAIFGIVASFPSNCMHSMVNGQAVAGLLAVAIQILSMINNSGPETSGLWYFLASTVFLGFAIICYWSMDNDYMRHYLLRIPDEDQLSTSLSVHLIESKSEILEALKDCWQMAASVICTFWASLAVFPGICVLVVPQYPNTSALTGRFFTPITTFLLFNCGDLAGRMCSAYLPFPTHRKNALLIMTISRGIIPLMILFCNVHPRNNTTTLFESDLFFPIFNSLTALTNGYVFSSAMVMASAHSGRSSLELTGFLMASALGIGLTLGAVSSTILLRII